MPATSPLGCSSAPRTMAAAKVVPRRRPNFAARRRPTANSSRKVDVPELPEVETIRAGLAPHVLHRTITGVEVYHPRAVRRHEAGPHHFTQQLRGRQVQAAVRRGKYLWLLLYDFHALVCYLVLSRLINA